MIDRLLTSWHWRAVETRLFEASPERTYAAAQRVKVADLSLAMAASAVGGRIRPDHSVFEALLASGFVTVDLVPGASVALCRIGKFWRFGGEIVDIATAEQFDEFGRPGYAKEAIGVGFDGTDASTRLTIDTRIVATDATTHRRFGRFWLTAGFVVRASRRQFCAATARILADS